jgi:hypothetical protein
VEVKNSDEKWETVGSLTTIGQKRLLLFDDRYDIVGARLNITNTIHGFSAQITSFGLFHTVRP